MPPVRRFERQRSMEERRTLLAPRCHCAQGAATNLVVMRWETVEFLLVAEDQVSQVQPHGAVHLGDRLLLFGMGTFMGHHSGTFTGVGALPPLASPAAHTRAGEECGSWLGAFIAARAAAAAAHGGGGLSHKC